MGDTKKREVPDSVIKNYNDIREAIIGPTPTIPLPKLSENAKATVPKIENLTQST